MDTHLAHNAKSSDSHEKNNQVNSALERKKCNGENTVSAAGLHRLVGRVLQEIY